MPNCPRRSTDHGMPCMEGISKARIEFGCEADQTGCIGCNQLENTRKPGGRFEQAGWWRVCGRIAKRLQQKPDIAVAGVPTANTSQSRRPAPFYTPVDLQRPTPLPPSTACSGFWSRNPKRKPPALFCQCANCPFRSSLRALSFPPTGTRCCSSVRPSAWSPKPVIRTAAAGWTAGRSARTFLTRRRPRRRRWHGTSRRSGAIGLAS